MSMPTSEDLRKRIVRAWQKRNLSTDELADLFDVSTATIKRLKRQFLASGSVEHKPHGGGVTPIIGEAQRPVVEALVQRHPDWSEAQYAKSLFEVHGISASAVTVGRAIRRLGYSVKKRRSSPPSGIERTSSSVANGTVKRSNTSLPRVWFLWAKPAPTRR